MPEANPQAMSQRQISEYIVARLNRLYIYDLFLCLHTVYHVSQQGYDLPPALTTAGFSQVLGGSFITSGSQDCTADGKTKI